MYSLTHSVPGSRSLATTSPSTIFQFSIRARDFPNAFEKYLFRNKSTKSLSHRNRLPAVRSLFRLLNHNDNDKNNKKRTSREEKASCRRALSFSKHISPISIESVTTTAATTLPSQMQATEYHNIAVDSMELDKVCASALAFATEHTIDC